MVIGERRPILIVGAGISGIGMAAHMEEMCPGKRYARIGLQRGQSEHETPAEPNDS